MFGVPSVVLADEDLTRLMMRVARLLLPEDLFEPFAFFLFSMAGSTGLLDVGARDAYVRLKWLL